MLEAEMTAEAVTISTSESAIDHRAELKALMLEINTASPSRIETLRAKMLEHLEAL